jgi:hypothetical protein
MKHTHGAAIMMAAVILLAAVVGVIGSKRGGEHEGIFDPAGFIEIRQPLFHAGDTPHGRLSVDYIEYINDNFYDRFAFSYREMHTAAWIVEELLAMGYTWDNIEVQEYTFDEVELFELPGVEELSVELISMMTPLFFLLEQTPFVHLGLRESRMSQNVILTVPGLSDEVMVVGAHYDSVMYPGASDNASGIALLLESAARMINTDNYYTIVYVFFGAEEAGLIGVMHYVNSLSEQDHENILFMINADVLLEGFDLFYMAGYYDDGESGANHITETWDSIAEDLNARYGFNLMPWPEGVFGNSDQLAFLPSGHTAMFLVGLHTQEGWYEREFEEVFMQMVRVLHSRRDDFHYINRTWPGKMEGNMRAFSIFLEEILLASY